VVGMGGKMGVAVAGNIGGAGVVAGDMMVQ
jgi:hypothetical protein